jgi:hypothetical protein
MPLADDYGLGLESLDAQCNKKTGGGQKLFFFAQKAALDG